MARKIEVEIVGDSRSLERAFKRSSNAAKDFNRDISKTGRLNQAARGGLTGAFGGRSTPRTKTVSPAGVRCVLGETPSSAPVVKLRFALARSVPATDAEM